MKKISLSVLVLWVGIAVSLSAIYIPVLSDSQELLINTLNSATGNILGNDLNFSLPLVSLLQGELNKDYFNISPNSGKSVTTSEKIPTIKLPATIVPVHMNRQSPGVNRHEAFHDSVCCAVAVVLVSHVAIAGEDPKVTAEIMAITGAQWAAEVQGKSIARAGRLDGG